MLMTLQKRRQVDLVPSQVAPAVTDDASLQLASCCAQGMSEQDLYDQLAAFGTSQMEVWRNTVFGAPGTLGSTVSVFDALFQT
eukprot:Skav236361  [mRNA]  locus=scaffold3883:44563:46247:+ [translate_table: standard]